MEPKHLQIFFEVVVLLLAISVHESAHAWMASRYGDPTARLLGRVSLNPIRHIDLFGTIILPAMLILSGTGFVFGWAKPTPVDPRNFKEPVKADIMTSVAGPASNFMLVGIAFFVLAGVLAVSANARDVFPLALQQMVARESLAYAGEMTIAFPITLFLANMILINVLLGVFNLVPLPPLDGSHVIRHLMPEDMRRIYDMAGMVGLILFMIWGSKYLWMVMAPILGILFGILRSIHG
ncbi:MAG: site-2 protease family protein [Acidobacteriota bacterium]|nr:site-2 protease family protein [Acidobacteriota bacterium]